MIIGELFAGIGGLGLGVAHVLGGRVAWQVEADEACQRVLRRRFGAALHGDVRTVGQRNLAPVDVICGGFPCQDLSVAGARAGLDGARSGLWREMVRIVGEVRPGLVVIENVPALLRHTSVIEAAYAEHGYRMVWTQARALDAGAPHRRSRAFALAWQPGALPSEWRHVAPTPWEGGGGHPWPTPCARDFRTGSRDNGFQERRAGPPQLNDLIGGRLTPAWVEALMGLPIGWTDLDADVFEAAALALIAAPCWPAGMVVEHPARGPQHEWEPPRTVAGPPRKGRPARLRQLGNAVIPRQAAVALSRLLAMAHAAETPAQGRLL